MVHYILRQGNNYTKQELENCKSCKIELQYILNTNSGRVKSSSTWGISEYTRKVRDSLSFKLLVGHDSIEGEVKLFACKFFRCFSYSCRKKCELISSFLTSQYLKTDHRFEPNTSVSISNHTRIKYFSGVWNQAVSLAERCLSSPIPKR